jgi:gluconate 5-dehydrogenase
MSFLEGRVAVVTGAAGTMGASVVEALLARGCRVAMVDVRPQLLQPLVEAHGNSVMAVGCDIRDALEVRQAHESIVRKMGPVAVLVNNAGILSNDKVEATTTETWRQVLAVNLDGAFFWAQAVVPGMKQEQWGRIVNVSSLAAKTGGLTAGTAYAVSKGALSTLTLSLARELAGHGHRAADRVAAEGPAGADTGWSVLRARGVRPRGGLSRVAHVWFHHWRDPRSQRWAAHGLNMSSHVLQLTSLAGRVVFLPGGYGDIGAGIARALARAGAHVAVAGRSLDKAQALARSLAAEGGETAIGLAMDAHDVADIRAATDRVAQHFGALDILVNCVGIQREERLADVTEAAFDEVVQVNLKSAMFLAQAAARWQVRAVESGRAPGRQVHLLSVRSQLGLRDRGYSAYCATKGALVMLIRQHAVELSAHGITVNGVAPTVVRGEMARHWLENPEVHTRVLQRIPLGRVAEPEDVAGPVLFFCSAAAGFVTGQVLYVDGGLSATQ